MYSSEWTLEPRRKESPSVQCEQEIERGYVRVYTVQLSSEGERQAVKHEQAVGESASIRVRARAMHRRRVWMRQHLASLHHGHDVALDDGPDSKPPMQSDERDDQHPERQPLVQDEAEDEPRHRAQHRVQHTVGVRLHRGVRRWRRVRGRWWPGLMHHRERPYSWVRRRRRRSRGRWRRWWWRRAYVMRVGVHVGADGVVVGAGVGRQPEARGRGGRRGRRHAEDVQAQEAVVGRGHGVGQLEVGGHAHEVAVAVDVLEAERVEAERVAHALAQRGERGRRVQREAAHLAAEHRLHAHHRGRGARLLGVEHGGAGLERDPLPHYHPQRTAVQQ